MSSDSSFSNKQQLDSNYDDQNNSRTQSDLPNENSSFQQSYSNQYEQNQQMILKMELEKYTIEKQKKIPYQQEIIPDLLQKLQDYKDMIKEKSGEELITLRIQQLVIVRLLVLNYGKSQFRLVLAHYHLGQAYLQYQCIEQAIEHISVAMVKNQKLFEEIPKTNLLQTYLQNTLAEALMIKGTLDEAIQILIESINMQQKINLKKKKQNQQIIFSIKSKILLSKCYCKQKQYNHALEIIKEIENQEIYLSKQDYAFTLIEKSSIFAEKKQFQKAINCLQKSIKLLNQIEYKNFEKIAQIYTTLSIYNQNINNKKNTLNYIEKIKIIYDQIYSFNDKKIIKIKRKLSTCLVQNNKFKQAVNQLHQIIDLQQNVYGNNSLQIAKTFTFLGNIYINLQSNQARIYLRKAMHIFNSFNQKKQVQEIQDKLKILLNSGYNTAEQSKFSS